jgi:hypothetical protein
MSEWTARFHQADIEEAVRAGLVRPHLGPRALLLPREKRLAVRCQRVQKAQMVAAGLRPYSVTEAEHNLEVYTGLNAMLRLLIGTTVSAGGTNYANGSARLCVGDGGGSVPTAAVGDTDLAAATGASHRYCNACDNTYPSVPSGGNNSASAVLTAVATVASGNANFVWNEWAMDKGGASSTAAIASGDMFNHKGVNLGTKTSASAWAFTVTITQS